jgi:hypothetical protein
MLFKRFYPRSVGLAGLPAYYDPSYNDDCKHFIPAHHEWPESLQRCLDKARSQHPESNGTQPSDAANGFHAS